MQPNAETAKHKGIFLLIPVSDTIPGMFLSVFSNVQMELISRGWRFLFITTDKVPLDKAREYLIGQAVASDLGLTYMLWLDTDMFISRKQVSMLIQYLEDNPDATAVSGLYFKKISFEPVCFQHTVENGREEYRSFCPPGQEPTRVDAVGLGCMLLRTGFVVEKMAPFIKNNQKLFWFDEYPEDINFCSLIRNAGGSIVVLPNVVVPHQGGYVSDMHFSKLKAK